MNPKFIVIADELIYQGNSLKVPAYYHAAAIKLAEGTKQEPTQGFLAYGNIEAVIHETVIQAVEILAVDIGHKISTWHGYWEGFVDTDFEFSVKFSEIRDNRAWLIPNTSHCRNYSVKFPKVKKP